ncbi:MAG: DUF1697 domain-containing protein [Propionicimonas sp.]
MFVVFLRGVNLGSHNKVPTKPLAARVAEQVGVPVRGYLQSGNLVVAGGRRDELAGLVGGLIRETTGLEISIVVRSVSELEKLLAADPWPDEDPVKVHLSMWEGRHDQAAAKAMAAADWGGDEIVFSGRNAWLHYAGQSHTSRLGNQAVEKQLTVVATARNSRTIRALVDLAHEG